jgi:hypothetical protein
MTTNNRRVLPLSEDLDDTVELPSLPSAAGSRTDTWVAPHLSDGAASAVTEEFLRPSVADIGARPEPAQEYTVAVARLAELDKELATRVEQLRLGAAEREDLRLRLERVQVELGNADKLRERHSTVYAAQQREWESERSQRDIALARAHSDLAELRRRSAAHSEALQHLEGRRQLFDAMFREREALLDEGDARAHALESDLATARAQREAAKTETEAAREQISAVQAQATAAQARVEQLSAVLGRAQDEIAAAQQQRNAALTGMAGLEHDVADHGEAVRVLHEQLRAAQLTIETLRGDLAAAEDLLRTHESEQQQRAARIARLESSESALRARLERAERRDGGAGEHFAATGDYGAPVAVAVAVAAAAPAAAAPAAAAPVDAEAAGAAAAVHGTHSAPDGNVRLLVRTDGDAGIVHVLRRTTTIGRTPDNDLRIDAEYISRHHAVVLVSANGAVLEDLNSTNGVFVNGARISRRQLSEGDLVTIGKTGFRYVLKPPSEAAAS